MMSLLAGSEQISAELIVFRRELHRYPELSLEESGTAARIAARLEQLGIPYTMNVGGHGLIAQIDGELPGPVIALRADMDALPITEETDLPFASERPGVMHACGHDAHTAILLGAAKLLLSEKDRLRGSVRLLFQAAEEINAGAKAMIADGALEGVSEIYGLHNLPTLSAGKAAVRHGALMGSVDRIDISLEGKGGHGAMPDQSVDPIVCASAIVMSLQTVISREISPFSPVVVTIGSIHAGEANNVIPQYCRLSGTVRTFDPAVQKQLPERIKRIVQSIAAGYRCNASVEYTEQVPVLVNHEHNVRFVETAIDGLIGAERRVVAEPTMAGEDFSVYLRHVPGCFFWLGSGPEEGAEHAYGLHHPNFTLHEACIPLGAALLTAIALSRIGNGDTMSKQDPIGQQTANI